MTRRIRAAVVERAATGPVLRDVDLAPPGPHDVWVAVAASGVCHTDLAYASGSLWDAFPAVLGHEFAGTVEAVGDAVTRVAPGDRVVVVNPHCGHCAACERGMPVLCRAQDDIPQPYADDGLLSSNGGFAEVAVVHELGCVPVPDDVPMEVAAVTGCAVTTGLGAVFNVARVAPGETVAILGCGGVGASVVMGARVAGAERIVAADPAAARRELASRLGATDTADGAEAGLREIAPDGFDHVFEASGRPEVMEAAVRLACRGGTATIIGAPPFGSSFRVDGFDFVVRQRRILACLRGSVRPHRDLDAYFRLYRRGLLDLDALVSSRRPLEEVGDAFRAAAEPDAGIRVLLTPGGAPAR